jgi:indole-3-glycerol phosphate synthase
MTVLDRIVAVKRSEVAAASERRAELRAAALDLPPARDFGAALRAGPTVGVIGEIKRRSPSAGWIREGAVAPEVARAYEACGAAALSVLTDAQFFGGALDDLRAVRGAVALPLLRKDFVIDVVQLHEARVGGADAALLIVRILADAQLADLLGEARAAGLATLVEAHDEAELARALAAGAEIVGVNSRDLATFRTDLSVVHALAGGVPGNVILVGESGIRARSDVEGLASAGYDAILVGERLMGSPDPGVALAGLAGVARGPARGGGAGVARGDAGAHRVTGQATG